MNNYSVTLKTITESGWKRVKFEKCSKTKVKLEVTSQYLKIKYLRFNSKSFFELIIDSWSRFSFEWLEKKNYYTLYNVIIKVCLIDIPKLLPPNFAHSSFHLYQLYTYNFLPNKEIHRNEKLNRTLTNPNYK